MTLAIIILAYVVNVFIARYINMINYKLWRQVVTISTWTWFIPIIGIVVEIIDLQDTKTRLGRLGELPSNKNWFNGKNW